MVQTPTAPAAVNTAEDHGTAPALVAPASFAQERLWLACQAEQEVALFNQPVIVYLPSELTAAQVEQALAALVQRHEVLRTALRLDDAGLMQVVYPSVPIHLPVTDLSDRDEQAAQRDMEALRLVETQRRFDFTTAPLWRAQLVRFPREWRLLLVAHHTIIDGASFPVLRAELNELAGALLAGRAADLPELDVQYADFAAWQRNQLDAATVAERVGFWRDYLAGAPDLHALPLDHPRTATTEFPGAEVRFTLPAGATDQITDLARRLNASDFMVHLAAYAALQATVSGETDVVVGVPTTARLQPELAALIGLMLDTVMVRVDTSGDPTFAELVGRVRQRWLAAWEHQDVPLQLLAEKLNPPRLPGVQPLYQIEFNFFDRANLGRCFGVARHELTVEVGGDQGRIEYRTDLFARDTVDRWAQLYQRLLLGGVAAPDTALSRLPLLDDAERTRVLHKVNDTAQPAPSAQTLPELVAAQVARTPDAVAVRFDDEQLTYAEVARWSDAVAAHLAARGVGPETLVGVCAERSLALVPVLLGVWKAGAGCVPLDPEYPADRLAYMRQDAQLAMVLDQQEVDASRHWPVPEPATAGPPPHPDNVAYVLYTSGSTGVPKGVATTHRAVTNHLHWVQRTYPLRPDDIVIQKVPTSFDTAVREIIWPLLAGATLVLAAPGGHKDPDYLRDLVNTTGATSLQFVPSLLAVFLAAGGPQNCPTLRRICVGGEALSPELAWQVRDAAPGCELINMYGVTEAAIDVTSWRCDGGDRVPIGAPIDNTRLYVLDRHGEPVPIGVPGELYIGGVQVARGYWGRPGMTAERFLPDPYGQSGARMYRTGDAARWRPDGTLEYLGRLDDQVKVRGVRLELGEITAALRQQPGVSDAAVAVREPRPGDQRLVAYLVGDADPGQVQLALKRSLPPHAVPTAYVSLPQLPTLPNGKLDRRSLPAPETGRAVANEPVAPTNATERLIAGIWEELLDVHPVGIDDDFYDLGGHSLLATQLVAKFRAAREPHHGELGVMDVVTLRTVRELARLVDTPASAGGTRPLLYELSRPLPAGQRAEASYVCVPYGGGSAAIYQPLADAMPAGHQLFAVSIPGHDVGLAEDPLPFDELAQRCTDEVCDRVDGPVVLYGHCGVGSALVVEVALRLEARGRTVSAIYLGAMFPWAAPKGVLRHLSKLRRLQNNQVVVNRLKGMGVDLDEIGPEAAMRVVSNLRADTDAAEQYFTDLFDRRVEPLRAPIISVVGSEDPQTDFYQERFREWHFLTGTTGLVVLAGAGHYFPKHRAGDLADIFTRVHPAMATAEPTEARIEAEGWQLADVHVATPAPPEKAKPGRFATVAIGQTITLIGSALTTFAVPVYTFLDTGSLLHLAVLWSLAILPWIVVGPIAGAVIDRFDRRKVMMGGCLAGLGVEAVILGLLWTGHAQLWHLYLMVVILASAATFQRLAYAASIPQLVPKRFLGHAQGVVQLGTGAANLAVPLVAAALLVAIGLPGIILIDAVTFVVAIGVLTMVRFPNVLGRRRRESMATELREGMRYVWRQAGPRRTVLLSAMVHLCAGSAIIMVTPLVLSSGSVIQLGQVAFVQGLGVLSGAVAMMMWGGPRRLRMRGTLGLAAGLGAASVLIGLQPSLLLIAVGVYLYGAFSSMILAMYNTLQEVKTPQRLHGRMLAMNNTVGWGVLPFTWLAGAIVAQWLDDALAADGALADTVGVVVGTGPGRGIALILVVAGTATMLLALLLSRTRAYWRFDAEIPDTLPDDLLGAEEREAEERQAEDGQRRSDTAYVSAGDRG